MFSVASATLSRFKENVLSAITEIETLVQALSLNLFILNYSM